jgi:hypothetical protein
LCRDIGVARTPAPAFRVHDDGQPLSGREIDDTIDLLMVKVTLRSSQYRVVINNDGGSGARRPNRFSVDGSDTGNDTVSGGIRAQVFNVTALPLRGER